MHDNIFPIIIIIVTYVVVIRGWAGLLVSSSSPSSPQVIGGFLPSNHNPPVKWFGGHFGSFLGCFFLDRSNLS